MQHYTKLLAEFVSGLDFSALSADAVRQTKTVILDWYAACFAGMKVNGDFNSAVRAVILGESSAGESSVLCGDRRVSEGNAAFMNAVYAHGADMDDGNKAAMGHVAAHVMSAVFAVAEAQFCRTGKALHGKKIITAINAGYEIFNRVAAAAQPGLARRGFHSTGMAGGIACAAAVGNLLGFDADRIYNAMSLGAVQSSGLLLIAESGQGCKPINPANAAKNGIFSARLAEKGVCAPRYPLESDKGWLHAVTDEIDESRLTEGLGRDFTINKGYLKPYPTCRHTHAPIQASLQLRGELTARHGEAFLDRIEAVNVYTYGNAIRIAGQIELPATDEDTKFSIHYAVATALEKGDFGLDALSTDGITDALRGLISRISLIEEAGTEDISSGIRGARVEIVMDDGQRIAEYIALPKGEGSEALALDEVRGKLLGCSHGIISEADAQRLEKNVLSIDEGSFNSVNHLIFQD